MVTLGFVSLGSATLATKLMIGQGLGLLARTPSNSPRGCAWI
jgi:hypothetical protein